MAGFLDSSSRSRAVFLKRTATAFLRFYPPFSRQRRDKCTLSIGVQNNNENVILLHIMSVEIDQSGKIEQTNTNTILCISNATWYSILLSSALKKDLQQAFRDIDQPRNYVLYTFSALLTILIQHTSHTFVVIDREYYGHEATIAELVYQMLGHQNIHLSFRFIGKKSQAHHKAYAVAINKLKAHKNVSLKEVVEILKKTEVGKRLGDA